MMALLRKLLVSLFCWVWVFSVGTTFGQSDSAVNLSEKISDTGLKSDLTYLSSEELSGRGILSEGLRQAALFIQNKFQEEGLLPFYPKYVQTFFWTKDTVLPKMIIGGRTYRYGTDYYMNFSGSFEKIKSDELIFVPGRGTDWPISAKDISGKVIVMVPSKKDSTFFSSEEMNFFILKAHAAGASAILIPVKEKIGDKSREGRILINPNLKIVKGHEDEIPVVYIDRKVFSRLLGKKNLKPTDTGGAYFQSENLISVNKKFKIVDRKVKIIEPTWNVTGYIAGKDTGSYIIFGAHYDHLGVKDGKIYYGADDNASGTAALLQLSEVFSKAYRAGFVPQKNLLFVAFSAEEEGLVGSKIFNARFPKGKKVDAMINMDMVGRRDEIHPKSEDYIYVLGEDWDSEFWSKILKNAEEMLPGFKPDYSIKRFNDPESLTERSDQYPFLIRGIPSLFFYDNMQADYHKPGDISAKIDWSLLKKRTQFIFLIGWQLAFGQGN